MTSESDAAVIVSVGYERRNLNELIDLLLENRVTTLVDVRLNAISRRKGFSKTALAAALNDAQIEYRHERELGNPQDNRDPLRQGLESARERYFDHLHNGASHVFDEIVELARVSRFALLCYEREHDQCHRSCILEAAQVANPALKVVQV